MCSRTEVPSVTDIVMDGALDGAEPDGVTDPTDLPPMGLAATPRKTTTVIMSVFVQVPDVVDPVPTAYATRMLE
jgi:hypothetical protein